MENTDSEVAFAVVSSPRFGGRHALKKAFLAWNPEVDIDFPAVLGFDHNGITVWNSDRSAKVGLFASREEIVAVSTVVVSHDSMKDMFYGMQLRLKAHDASQDGETVLEMVVKSDSRSADEYSANRIVLPAQHALGTPTVSPAEGPPEGQ